MSNLIHPTSNNPDPTKAPIIEESNMSELEKYILDDIIIHEDDCNLSLSGEPCDCVQKNVANKIILAVQKEIEAAEVRGRQAGERIWKREHDMWKRTAEQFIKREQLGTKPPTIVVQATNQSNEEGDL